MHQCICHGQLARPNGPNWQYSRLGSLGLGLEIRFYINQRGDASIKGKQEEYQSTNSPLFLSLTLWCVCHLSARFIIGKAIDVDLVDVLRCDIYWFLLHGVLIIEFIVWNSWQFCPLQGEGGS